MKFARTVCGDIQAEEMGFTYPHEHLYAVPPTCQKDRDLEVSDYEGSVAELKLFKSVGGQTLVEASTLDYGRNLSLLKKMSEETGVHVIATTGFNKHIYYPNWVEEKSTEEISDILADDILEGRDGIRAGFIKIGTYYNMIHPLEEKTAVAAAQAQKRCGAPIWGHTEAGTMGMELLDILARENVDFSTVALGHLDRNPDEYYLLKLAVFFRNQPVGCTATIVSQMYEENGVEIDPTNAALLCSAIISDTLMFRSPTCTPLDENTARKLAQTAGVEIEILAQEMFRAGSNLKGKSAQDICFLDFKKFTVNETVFGVGQVNSMSSDELEGIKKKVKPYLEKACADSGVNMIFFMLTNILTESSELLCGGPEAKEKILNAYDLPEDTDTIMLKGVVSRKKQLVPTLVSVLQQ